jgi:hypothetical protein
MKKLTLSLCAIVALASAAFAGPTEVRSSNKDKVVQQARTEVSCFNDREWNFDLFGLYGFTGNSWTEDRYLQADHIWGGGVGVSYFFMRYLGAGIDGWAAGAHGDTFGQVTGNLIMRYPIPNTCFAPYGYLGGGVIFSGSDVGNAIVKGKSVSTVADRSDAEGVGKGGIGIEYRFTPRIGVINDFSWNVVNGPHNNYGMLRAGIRFAF